MALVKSTERKRDVPLDAIRGGAALLIVIVHYRTGFLLTEKLASTTLYGNVFGYMYQVGSSVVDLFFCLSGYVFFWKYKDAIIDGSISFKNYMIMRLTRLYPLIIVSLLIVAVLNYFLLFKTGRFFLYSDADISTFIANFFFLQSGFLNVRPNFNQASWSLSVEFFLYIIFFAVLWRFKKNYLLVFTGIFFFALVAFQYKSVPSILFMNEYFLRGFQSFFMGALIAYLYIEYVSKFSRKWREVIGLTAFALAALTVVLVTLKFQSNYYAEKIVVHDWLNATMIVNPGVLIGLVVSPALRAAFSFRIFRFLGDISYSIYLLHIPMQLIFIIAYKSKLIGFGFDSKITFWTYLALTIAAGTVSFYCFEKPMMKKLRRKFIKKPESAQALDSAVTGTNQQGLDGKSPVKNTNVQTSVQGSDEQVTVIDIRDKEPVPAEARSIERVSKGNGVKDPDSKDDDKVTV